MVRSTLALFAALTLTSCASVLDTQASEGIAAASDDGPPESWRGVDAATGQLSSPVDLKSLVANFPDSSSVRLRLLGALFRDDDAAGVIEQVEWLSARGYSFSEAGKEQLLTFAQEEHAARMVEALRSDAPVIAASMVFAEIPAEIRLSEATLYDPQEQRLFVTSIVSRGLYVKDEGLPIREVPLPNVGSVAGIVLDEARGVIWIASGVVDPTPVPETAFRGVIALDRQSLEPTRWLSVPDGATVSDIAVGPDGTVYASDPVNGGVWAASVENSAMWLLIPPGKFRSPQGIAVRPDNTAFYISDYRYGIAQVVLPTREIYRMRADEPMLLDGIDGMWLHGNRLITVQNGVSPHRITAFEVGEGACVIASHQILEAANPRWTEPLSGAISGDTLFYIGTGQWDVYGEGGALQEGMSPRPTQVRALQLVETASQVP